MATYEYMCSNNHVYVENRPMTEESKVDKCEICNEQLRRIWSAPPVQFKGKGFYSTGG